LAPSVPKSFFQLSDTKRRRENTPPLARYLAESTMARE
jgi:hypothetical protein